MKRRNFIHKGVGLSTIASLNPKLMESIFISGDKRPELRTTICNLFNIEYPILQAGMGGVAGPELAAAVSNAGGLGIISGTMIPPDELRALIRKVRSLTDRPFGVNLLLQKDMFPPRDFVIPDSTVESVHSVLNQFRKELNIQESDLSPPILPPLIAADFEVILEEKVPVWSVGLGIPSREMTGRCKKKGIKVMVMVCTVDDALEIDQLGVDVIVAQGSEAGGHRSTWEKKKSSEFANIGTLPLVSEVVEKVSVPVVAAGGIVDGKGLLAALSQGAQGALIGTRFIAATESIAPDFYKRKIEEESGDSTTVTDVFTGMYARVIRNKFTQDYEKSEAPVFPPGRQFFATMDIVGAAERQQRSDYFPLYAGQGIGKIRSTLSVKEIFDMLIDETFTAYEQLTRVMKK